MIFIFWLSYQRKKSEKATKEQSNEFWEKERQSNLTRRKDISCLDYITLDFENLPFSDTEDEEIQYVQDQIKKLKDQKIVNLNGISNTDLKLTYGTANINDLTTFDQNYTFLIRNLNKWGLLLYASRDITAAKQVLEYAISIQSDISQTYLTLAAIYADEHNLSALQQLSTTADTITSPIKQSLLTKLDAIIERASHAQK